jgi:membrane-bound ClpP family serine protease
MLNVIIAVVVIILLTVGIVWLIDKFVPKKMKPIINIVLWAVIIFLSYLTFMSVYEEIKFNKLKVERYKKVIDRLIDIRDSELAYKDVHGVYTDDFSKLIKLTLI